MRLTDEGERDALGMRATAVARRLGHGGMVRWDVDDDRVSMTMGGLTLAEDVDDGFLIEAFATAASRGDAPPDGDAVELSRHGDLRAAEAALYVAFHQAQADAPLP